VIQVEQSVRCVCVGLPVCRTITFELNDLLPTYLAHWFSLILSTSLSKVKVTGQSSPPEDEKYNFNAMDARYEVTCFWLFIEFSKIKWSVRPRVRAFWLFFYIQRASNSLSLHMYWLWPLCVADADIIFSSCRLFFSSPNLSRRRLGVCHTSTHDVALVQI